MNILKLHFKRTIQLWLLLGTPLKVKCGLLFESLDFMAPVSGDCEFCTSSGLGAGSNLHCRNIGRGFTVGPVWKYPCSLFLPWSDYILSILRGPEIRYLVPRARKGRDRRSHELRVHCIRILLIIILIYIISHIINSFSIYPWIFRFKFITRIFFNKSQFPYLI